MALSRKLDLQESLREGSEAHLRPGLDIITSNQRDTQGIAEQVDG